MGVDMPAASVASILTEQAQWEKKRQLTSSKEYLHKRCWLGGLSFNVYCPFCVYRNMEKKKKKARYEQEKVYMEAMRGLGSAVGEYVGDGKGNH